MSHSPVNGEGLTILGLVYAKQMQAYSSTLSYMPSPKEFLQQKNLGAFCVLKVGLSAGSVVQW